MFEAEVAMNPQFCQLAALGAGDSDHLDGNFIDHF